MRNRLANQYKMNNILHLNTGLFKVMNHLSVQIFDSLKISILRSNNILKSCFFSIGLPPNIPSHAMIAKCQNVFPKQMSLILLYLSITALKSHISCTLNFNIFLFINKYYGCQSISFNQTN